MTATGALALVGSGAYTYAQTRSGARTALGVLGTVGLVGVLATAWRKADACAPVTDPETGTTTDEPCFTSGVLASIVLGASVATFVAAHVGTTQRRSNPRRRRRR